MRPGLGRQEVRPLDQRNGLPEFLAVGDEKDPGLLHLLRHFIGCNKHWTIRTDTGDTLEDWMATAKETPLGRYGC